MSRLVVVSNRTYDPDSPTPGGLAVALNESLQQRGGIWFGWSGKLTEADPATQPVQTREVGNMRLATIDMSQRDYDAFYLGYSNNVLWPVFHYRLDLANFDVQFSDGYRRVNRLFAQKLLPLLEPDDVLWVHDYHLIPLATELRAQGCRNRIGFFLHIPVPPPQIMAAIPEHEWLMRSLFAYDLVGFQAHTDVTHFVRYAEAEAEAQLIDGERLRAFGRTIRVGAFPIGIDVDGFSQMATDDDGLNVYEQMRDEYSRRKLLLGVDRLDYSKGLPQRVQAFRAMLEMFPEMRKHATLIQIAAPSREDVSAYSRLRQQMDALCGSINGDYGELDWMPVRYIHRSLDRTSLPGLYRASRVALVTPLRDGMNLVAKEFIAAQDAKDPGVLVLSRFAGAAEQLTDALLVNPYDIQGTARAIHAALTMPLEERVRRHAALLAQIRRHDVHHWAAGFLGALDGTNRPAQARRTRELADSVA